MDIECCSACSEELTPSEYEEKNKYKYCTACIALWGDEGDSVWEEEYDEYDE